MKQINRVIRTQKDLDMILHEESGMFYISLSGQIATFSGKFSMTSVSAFERLTQIAAGQSQMISECMALNQKKDAEEAIDVALQTFMVPYRIH